MDWNFILILAGMGFYILSIAAAYRYGRKNGMKEYYYQLTNNEEIK